MRGFIPFRELNMPSIGTLQLKFHYKMTTHYYHNKGQFLKKFAVSSWFGVGGGGGGGGGI